MKTCTKCKKSKNLDCFHKDKTTVDGLYSWCKPCKKARKRYPERQIKRKKEYYIENKNYILKRQAKYYAENKQARRAYQIKYEKENPHIRANISSKRRARQKQAIPKWANLNKIKNIYKNCPKGMEVDHIVPLQHPLVCGLHVEDNLQYLPVSENRKKHNKLDYKPQSIEA